MQTTTPFICQCLIRTGVKSDTNGLKTSSTLWKWNVIKREEILRLGPTLTNWHSPCVSTALFVKQPIDLLSTCWDTPCPVFCLMVGYFITNQLDNCSPWQANQIERTRVIKTPFFRSVFSMASFSLKKCSLLVYMENMLRFPLTHTKQLTFFTFYNTIRNTCKWNLGFGFNENKSFVWLMIGLCSFIVKFNQPLPSLRWFFPLHWMTSSGSNLRSQGSDPAMKQDPKRKTTKRIIKMGISNNV